MTDPCATCGKAPPAAGWVSCGPCLDAIAKRGGYSGWAEVERRTEGFEGRMREALATVRVARVVNDPRWTLIDGDCVAAMRRMGPGSVDHVITDPPWPNMPAGLYPAGGPERLPKAFRQCARVAAKKLVVHLGRRSDPRCLSGIPASMPFVCVCWLRYAVPSYLGTVLGSGDVAYVYGDHQAPDGKTLIPGEVTSNSALGNEAKGLHPSPRKLEHLLWLITWMTNPGDLVLDPFAGSGTTGVACLRLGRRFIGIEKDPAFAAGARKRLHLEVELSGLDMDRVGQEPLFRVEAAS